MKLSDDISKKILFTNEDNQVDILATKNLQYIQEQYNIGRNQVKKARRDDDRFTLSPISLVTVALMLMIFLIILVDDIGPHKLLFMVLLAFLVIMNIIIFEIRRDSKIMLNAALTMNVDLIKLLHGRDRVLNMLTKPKEQANMDCLQIALDESSGKTATVKTPYSLTTDHLRKAKELIARSVFYENMTLNQKANAIVLKALNDNL